MVQNCNISVSSAGGSDSILLIQITAICAVCSGPPEAVPSTPQATVLAEEIPISICFFVAETDVLDEWHVGDTILNLYDVKDVFAYGMGLVSIGYITASGIWIWQSRVRGMISSRAKSRSKLLSTKPRPGLNWTFTRILSPATMCGRWEVSRTSLPSLWRG